MNTKETVLVDLERVIYAAAGLMQDTVLPMFQGMTLDGILEDIQKQELCGEAKVLTREQAALSWMEDHYDSLASALFAVGTMVEILEP